MKKFTVLGLAMLMILAFGAVVYAQPEAPTPAATYPPPGPKVDFRASGMFYITQFLDQNVPYYNAGATLYGNQNPGTMTFNAHNEPTSFLNKTINNWDMRAHLKFDAVLGKELSGTMMFEIDTFRWGMPAGGYPGIGREANGFGSWTTDRTSIEVKNIYFDVGLPYFGIPVPMTVRLGAQPFSIRPTWFLYSDGMGIWPSIKLDPVTIQPLWAKPFQGDDFKANGVNVYGAVAQANLSTVSIGGYWLYYNMDTFPLQVSAPTGIAGFPAALTPTVAGTDRAKIWWLGLYADGKMGPVNFNFDATMDKGRSFSPTVDQNVKYFGYAGRLKIDYPWERFNFGVVGMYASGANTEKTSATGLPGSLTANGAFTHRVGEYINPVGSEIAAINGESLVVYSMEAGAIGGAGLSERSNYNTYSPGFGGTWFAKLYGSYKVTPDYKITLQALYIGDTTKNGNTLGNAINGATGNLRDDRTIGYEFDFLNEWMIYKNLRFFAGIGYLIAGSATDFRQGTSDENFKMHNPWALRTSLRYIF